MRSIRTSLMLPLLVGIVLLATAAASLLYVSMRRALLAQFDESLRAKAAALGSLVMLQSDGRLEFDYADQNDAEFRPEQRPEYFQIRLADGTTVGRSATLKGAELAAHNVVETQVLPNGCRGRSLTASFIATRDNDEAPTTRGSLAAAITAPAIFVTVARETGPIDTTLVRLRTYLVVSVLSLVAGVALLVLLVVRRGLRPLNAIAEHADRLTADSLHSPFPHRDLPQELAPIAAKLNDLLDRLAAAFERESRFAASAAHELRTPVAEIRAAAEVALQWPELAQSQRALGDAVEVCGRMQALIDALLRMARARAGQVVARPEDVNIGAIVEQSIRSLATTADERGLRITVNNAAPVAAWTDPTLATSIVGNLVANAVHHTPPRGGVTVEVSHDGASVRLDIANDSVELSDEDLRMMREPFWTRSSSRSDQRHGLGLALVAEYARILDVPLLLEVTMRRQLRASVVFPASRRPARLLPALLAAFPEKV